MRSSEVDQIPTLIHRSLASLIRAAEIAERLTQQPEAERHGGEQPGYHGRRLINWVRRGSLMPDGSGAVIEALTPLAGAVERAGGELWVPPAEPPDDDDVITVVIKVRQSLPF